MTDTLLEWMNECGKEWMIQCLNDLSEYNQMLEGMNDSILEWMSE
mgnify:CR=1 FL=1